MITIFAIELAVAVYLAVCFFIYNKTTYKAVTHNSYFKMISDKGRRGEYEIYRNLNTFEKRGYKFLFNVYLPKANGKTTEIDVMMIGAEAVFVFESKNYSGWIFGNDSQKNWTQVLPTGRGKSQKEHFYNPVWQNRTHCKTLCDYLPQGAQIYSVVLFSNRCTFKDVTVNAADTVVIHRSEVSSVVNRLLKGSQAGRLDVEEIYGRLYPYSQVSEDVKQAHVEEINAMN